MAQTITECNQVDFSGPKLSNFSLSDGTDLWCYLWKKEQWPEQGLKVDKKITINKCTGNFQGM